MTEVEALKKAMVEAEKKAAIEQALHEKHEARVEDSLNDIYFSSVISRRL